MTDFHLPIPIELIERIAESIAQRAFDAFAERLSSGTPWIDYGGGDRLYQDCAGHVRQACGAGQDPVTLR